MVSPEGSGVAVQGINGPVGKALALGSGEAALGEEIGGAIVHRNRGHGTAAAVGVEGDGQLYGFFCDGARAGDSAGEGAAGDLAVIGHGAMIGPACKQKVVDHVPVESSVGNIRGLVVHRAVENAASDAAIIEDHIAVERAVFNRALAGDGVVERAAGDGGRLLICHIAGKDTAADGAVIIADRAGEGGALGVCVCLNGAAVVIYRAALIRSAARDLAAVGVHGGAASKAHAAAASSSFALCYVAVGNGAAIHGKDAVLDIYAAAAVP